MRRTRQFIALLVGLGLAAVVVGCTSKPSSGDDVTSDSVLEIRAGDTVTVDGWSKTDQVVGGRPVWMSPETAVDDSMVDDARVTLDAAGHPAVLVTLDSEGAARLQELTTRRTSRPVVVVVDGEPVSAPIVLSPLGGSFMVTAADLDEAEAKDFAARLRDAGKE